MAVKTVDEYIDGLDGWQKDAVVELRALVLETAPDAEESVKWAQPVYSSNGPFCYIKAFKNNVNIGFWRGADVADAQGLLEGSGDKMRHVKLTASEDIPTAALKEMVLAAAKLNQTKGDPTKG